MNEALAGVIIVCATLLCITLVTNVTKLILARNARPTGDPEEARRLEDERMRERIERTPKPTPGIPWEAREPGPDRPAPSPDHGLPLPVDSMRPPTVKIYRPKPNSTSPPPRCVCHDLPVDPGEKVLWWPMPDSEEIRVFCQRGDTP